MKINEVRLKNIRQFSGEQVIRFSSREGEKVTLVHGPNTTGKTTLLNAIFWCLYGKFLEDFKEQERLLSLQSESNAFSVSVEFENNGKRYLAERGGSSQPKDSPLRLVEVRSDGRSVPHHNPVVLINTILPESLAGFFFFAGEMIKKGFSTTATLQTTTAIRKVLGLNLVELAVEDLKEIRKRKLKKFEALSKGTSAAEISEQLASAEEEVDVIEAQLSTLRPLISQLERDKNAEFEKLREFEPTAKLQRKRDGASARAKSLKNVLDGYNREKQALIPEYGASVFLVECEGRVSELLDSAVTARKIPSPYDKEFVESILRDELCICGRQVKIGTAEFKCVHDLINSATEAVVITNSLAVKGASGAIAAQSQGAAKKIREVLVRINRAESELEEAEKDVAMLDEQFRKHEAGNVRESEAKLETYEKEIRRLVANRGNSERLLADRKAEVTKKRQELARAESSTPETQLAREEYEFVESILDKLLSALESVEASSISRLGELLNEIVGSSTRQRYRAQVSSDYQVKLFSFGAGEAGRQVFVLSSGEQRLLDLCFAASLVAICRERQVDKSSIVQPGAIAPLVVDAPFGELDPEYQALAVKTMIDRSDQLVLMLSKTHFTDAVQREVAGKIGAEYLFVGHRKDAQGAAADVDISLHGKVYRQMMYDSNTDRTEIVSVRG